MKAPSKYRMIAAALSGLLFFESAALAQAIDGEPAVKKAEAQSHFEKGLALFQQEAWDAALSEFLRSRATYPTRSATKNAALCLRKLKRADEALDMFEELLGFPNLPDDERKVAEAAIAELRADVGTLQIMGGVAGASLVIDGRYRGTLPLAGPLRVDAGSHDVRAFKAGVEPLGATVEVAAGRATIADLRSMSTRGRLKVIEQGGRSLDVVIDGTVVGKSPWEGSLSVGDHVVTLRGSGALDAVPDCAGPNALAAPRRDVEFGTQPVSVPIRQREVTLLTLRAEALDTWLRVEPVPGGARVAIDSVVVGWGAWEGRLRVGEHRIEVTADGFAPEVKRVTLERQKRQTIAIELRRHQDTDAKRTARYAGAGAAFGVGALGIGIGAVTGGIALAQMNAIKERCGGLDCPIVERENVEGVSRLGTASTVGLIIGGVGVAAGTIVLLATRPSDAPRSSSAVKWQAGVGLGRLAIEGAF